MAAPAATVPSPLQSRSSNAMYSRRPWFCIWLLVLYRLRNRVNTQFGCWGGGGAENHRLLSALQWYEKFMCSEV